MNAERYRRPVAPFQRSHDSVWRRLHAPRLRHTLVFCALLGPWSAPAQAPQPDRVTTRSVSGQFIATGPKQFSRLAGLPSVAAETNLVRLEPSLLVVSAERIKDSLGQRLGPLSHAPWRWQIYLVVHPAESLDDKVTIVSQLSEDGCNYLVALPDVLPQRSYVRAMTGVILLELASRNTQSHSADIPSWLTDGLAEELLETDASQTILSVPHDMVNGLPLAQINDVQHGRDPQARAWKTLQRVPPLTFSQMAWPTAAQVEGEDGGAYRASAELFVDELLSLREGARHLRAMVESLPRFYNWQTAFQSAFRDYFPRPLDLEKWWALKLTNLAAHDRGARWTLTVSRAKLDELLTVPVELRTTSNSLPAHVEISLQAVIRNLDARHQQEILQARWRELGMAELRMAPPVANLAAGYRLALTRYLGQPGAPKPSSFALRRGSATVLRTSAAKTLQQLDALDAQRRRLESTFPPVLSAPG